MEEKDNSADVQITINDDPDNVEIDKTEEKEKKQGEF